MIYKSYS